MEIVNGGVNALELVYVVDCLAWQGAVVHALGVFFHGFNSREDVHCVERLLDVGAIEEESVGVEICYLAGQWHLP